MVVLTKRQVAALLHERRQAMAETRFRPENYHEIPRVLGGRFAPDLPRVFTKQRAHVASAYLKRLQRDVQRCKDGYYRQLHAMPLQIKRMTIHKEDPRSFTSVLVPKLKLPPLAEDGTSSQHHHTPSPKSLSPKVVSPTISVRASPKGAGVGAGSPSLVSPLGGSVVDEGSSYVPHKSFSPHAHTHVHVLFKQMGGSVTPRKGSVASVTSSVSKSSRSPHFPVMAARLNGAGESSGKSDDGETMSMWSVETPPQPYSFINLSAGQPALPAPKKQLFVHLMSRPVERPSPNRTPRVQPLGEVFAKPQSMLPYLGHMTSRKSKNGIPSKVEAALAAGGTSSTALYKFVLPSRLPPAHHTVAATEQRRPSVMASQLRLPAIASKAGPGNLLAISTVQQASAIRAAA